MTRGTLILLTLLLPLLTLSAQDEEEYRMEIGAGAGLMAYEGDFNGNILKGMKPWGTLLAKYHPNPRMAFAASLGMGKISGTTDDADTWMPIERYEFNHTLTEFCLRYEYNFWPFGTGREYRGAKRFTPFITLGLAMTHHSGENSGMTVGLPLGAGIKYKLGQRLNLTAEWAMRFTPSDQLDGRKDVYGIQSSGLFKNTDCYSVLQVALTYDIWAKCTTCHKE